MQIEVKDKKLRAALDDEALCKRRYGADMTKKLTMRIGALEAAQSLATFWPPFSGPERVHQLKGDLKGTFSVDLKQPYRLLVRPLGEGTTEAATDEQERWKSITAIEVIGIEDTHG